MFIKNNLLMKFFLIYKIFMVKYKIKIQTMNKIYKKAKIMMHIQKIKAIFKLYLAKKQENNFFWDLL